MIFQKTVTIDFLYKFLFVVVVILFADILLGQGHKNPTIPPYGGHKDERRLKGGMPKAPLNFSKAIFDTTEFKDTAHFNFSIFDCEAFFKSSRFRREALFTGSKFRSSAWFWEALFSRNAYFGGSYFNAVADFSLAQYEQEAYYRSAKFDSLANFNSAKFEGDATFEGVLFSKLSDFSNTYFYKNANFTATKFESMGQFSDVHFLDKANFSRAIFGYPAIFTTAQFSTLINFEKAVFNDNVFFNNSRFAGSSRFKETSFKKQAKFDNSSFDDIADFSNATFEGETSFKNVAFDSTADFTGVEFRNSTDFKDVKFNNVTFARGKIFDNFHIGSKSNPKMDFTRTLFSENGRLVLHDIVDLVIQREKLVYVTFYDSLSYDLKKLILDHLKTTSFENRKDIQFELDYIFAKSTMYQRVYDNQYSRLSWLSITRWAKFLYYITMGLGYRPFRLVWWIILIVACYSAIFLMKMPNRIMGYIKSSESTISTSNAAVEQKKFLHFIDNLIACLYFSAMIFVTFRLKKDILVFFTTKEKALIVSEWILGFLTYMVFLTLSKSGSILLQLRNLFI